MRGKHGKAAANRHENADLEQRATTAERQAKNLSVELEKLKADSAQRVEGLRAQLAQARNAAKEGAVPAIVMLEEQNRALRSEREKAKQAVERGEWVVKKYGEAFCRFVEMCGFNQREAWELVAIATGGISLDGIYADQIGGIGGVSRRLSAKAATGIQQARGERRPDFEKLKKGVAEILQAGLCECECTCGSRGDREGPVFIQAQKWGQEWGPGVGPATIPDDLSKREGGVVVSWTADADQRGEATQ
jgi:hypothetical protein